MARPSVSRAHRQPRHITVPERGHIDIDTDVWSALSTSHQFHDLHSRGVVEVTYLPRRRVRLGGTCYVGRAICGDVLLDLHEKIDGALAALVSYASGRAFKLAKASSSTSQLSGLVSLLVAQLLDAIATYVSAGRQFTYARVAATGSLAGGRLDMTRSMRLRARGLGHILAYERNRAKFNIPVNNVILASLVAIERMTKVVQLDGDLLVQSRALSMLFADCRENDLLIRDRSYVVNLALQLAREGTTEIMRDLMTLSAVILANESFSPTFTGQTDIPRTWFLNLETLFESAVHRVFCDIASNVARIARGVESPAAIFDSARGTYRAHPDLVIRSASGDRMVGDVKYKTFDGLASSSDVYQLLVHAEAFEASRAFLIYPGIEYKYQGVGKTRAGIETSFFVVRPNYLDEDLRRVAALLNLTTIEQTNVGH